MKEVKTCPDCGSKKIWAERYGWDPPKYYHYRCEDCYKSWNSKDLEGE